MSDIGMSSSYPPQLCRTCWHELFGPTQWIASALRSVQERIRGNMTHTYSARYHDLTTSEQAGCRWCTLVLTLARPAPDEKFTLHNDSSVHITVNIAGLDPYHHAEHIQQLNLRIRIDSRKRDVQVAYDVYTTDNDPAAQFIIARDIIRDVASPRTLETAMGRVQDCIRNHQSCSSPSKSFLPTRVIDCEDPHHAKLIATSGESGQYIALSYVWGEPQPHSTTSKNIETYLRSIDLTVLPQTIKDAISTTHALGFRYLWADTLCIVQDSPEDKAREIVRMCQIYSDAYLSLIAASANKVSEGFLQDRAEAFSPNVTLPVLCPGSGSLGTVYLLSEITSWLATPHEPVDSRAWCLQEWLLSRRALVFSSHTLEFRCQKTIVNVGTALRRKDLRSELFRLPAVVVQSDTSLAAPEQVDIGPWSDVHDAWWTIVAQYTKRGITEPADVLVALGGVAEKFQSVYSSRYLAGLWEHTLLRDLLWCAARSENARLTTYRAPSWSWAAVTGGVFDPPQNTEHPDAVRMKATMISSDVTLARDDSPFGEVVAGSIVIRAPMVHVMRVENQPHDSQYELYMPRSPAVGLSEKTTHARFNPMSSSESSKGEESDDSDADLGVWIGSADMDTADDCSPGPAWVAVIWTNWKTSSAAGLILLPADMDGDLNETQAIYRRAGLFTCEEAYLSWMDGLPEVDIEIV